MCLDNRTELTSRPLSTASRLLTEVRKLSFTFENELCFADRVVGSYVKRQKFGHISKKVFTDKSDNFRATLRQKLVP